MIPQIYIIQWKKNVPWINDYQAEQDLIIERAMVEIFSDNELNKLVAFRGGTALHKLFLKPQVRYSEDIDLVQVQQASIGNVLDILREKLEFLGNANYKASEHNATLIYHFESEAEPVVRLKLKVEINTREHFTVFGHKKYEYSVENEWFKGNCEINTFSIEELLSTKMRALYQRRKGRDLFDLYYAAQKLKINFENVVSGFKKYLASEELVVSKKEYITNMEAKLSDTDFVGDTKALLRTEIDYDPGIAWELVKNNFIEKLP